MGVDWRAHLGDKEGREEGEVVLSSLLHRGGGVRGGHTLETSPSLSGGLRSEVERLIRMGGPIQHEWAKLSKGQIANAFILARINEYWLAIRGRKKVVGDREETELDCYCSKDVQSLIRESGVSEGREYSTLPGSVGLDLPDEGALNLGKCELGSAILTWQMAPRDLREQTGITSSYQVSAAKEEFSGIQRWVVANTSEEMDGRLLKAHRVDPLVDFAAAGEASEAVSRFHSMERLAKRIRRPLRDLLILHQEDSGEKRYKLPREDRIRTRLALEDRGGAFQQLGGSFQTSMAWAEGILQRGGEDDFPFSETERNKASEKVRYKILKHIDSKRARFDSYRQMRIACELTSVAHEEDEYLECWVGSEAVEEDLASLVGLSEFFPRWRANEVVDFWALAGKLFAELDSRNRRHIVDAALTEEMRLRPEELRGLIDFVPDFMANISCWKEDFALSSRMSQYHIKEEQGAAIELVNEINKMQFEEDELGTIGERVKVLFKVYRPPVERPGFERETLDERTREGKFGLGEVVGGMEAVEEISSDHRYMRKMLGIKAIRLEDRTLWMGHLTAREFRTIVRDDQSLTGWMGAVINRNEEGAPLWPPVWTTSPLTYHRTTFAGILCLIWSMVAVYSFLWALEMWKGGLLNVIQFQGTSLHPLIGIIVALVATFLLYITTKKYLRFRRERDDLWKKIKSPKTSRRTAMTRRRGRNR